MQQTLEAFRQTQNYALLAPYAYQHNGQKSYDLRFDAHYAARRDFILYLYDNHTKSDKPLIIWLLREELKASELKIPVYTCDLCAFMLYKHLEFEDIYLLFEAKFHHGFALQWHLDIELIFGLDRLQTKAILMQKKQALDAEILKCIAHYESNPDASFKTRAAYIAYFESRKIRIIRNELAFFEQHNPHFFQAH